MNLDIAGPANVSIILDLCQPGARRVEDDLTIKEELECSEVMRQG
jgi:hypothetical protein